MSRGQKAALAAATTILLGIVAGVWITFRSPPQLTLYLTGAVLAANEDPRKQMPIPGARITALSGLAKGDCKSDSAGFFHLTLHPGVKPGEAVTLNFSHPDYQLLRMTETAGDQIYLARLVPISREIRAKTTGPEVPITDVRVRYSVKATSTVEIGMLAKTFEVSNKNGVRCHGQPPCSPDGKWKATIGSLALDAGEGNEFRDVRASCIAGPCPFTKIESGNASVRERVFKVSARNWSATATFLVEAQVVRTSITDIVRLSYPVIFGQAMNFTLPATAEGPSIEANLNGADIVFPLGPALILSWGSCTAGVDADQPKLIRCELKPGYRFKNPKD
jgi:hypothetical protein